MIITVAEFRERTRTRLDELVRELQTVTGRFGAEEASAWKQSLPMVANAFSSDAFLPLHIYFGSCGNLALEYQLPASSSWCDLVFLGRHENRPAAVVVELKNWLTRADQPGIAEGLITRKGRQELHPSDQVRGYAQYCARFHSAVHEAQAEVHGCVLFTGDFYTAAYSAAPNLELVREYPIFTLAAEHAQEAMPKFFSNRLSAPDPVFAAAFDQGTYRQDRGFMRQIGAQILSPSRPEFELLDGQRLAFAVCEYEAKRTRDALSSGQLRKRVVIVKGPPGSGKSAVAARLWASIVSDENWPEGNVLMVTTSRSQNSNWGFLFTKVSGSVAARGTIRKASAFTPLSTGDIGRLREKFGKSFLEGVGDWREHLANLKRLGIAERKGTADNENLVTIVDEAHALINPEKQGGVGQFGFAPNLGPQAYHIIRASVLTVLFLDPQQGFRNRENTTLDEINRWSNDLGAGDPEVLNLEGVQFRCAGSPEYVDWVEALLRDEQSDRNRLLSSAWRHRPPLSVATHENVVPFSISEEVQEIAEDPAPYGGTSFQANGGFDFRVFSDPESMEAALRTKLSDGFTARLLSSDCREWKTRDSGAPHGLPGSVQDFHEPYEIRGTTKYWSRPWNVLHRNGEDYTGFIQGAPGTEMSRNPLSEVGCPYTVRGFDYDYVGILWLNDFFWRGDRWEIDPKTIFDAGLADLVQRAKKNPDIRNPLRLKVAQALRILLTRPLRGAFLWIPDELTRQHVQDSLA